MLHPLFQCDPDIRLTGSDIYLDPAEPREIGIVSHGHSDHIGHHQHFVATPPTASFLRARVSSALRGTELAYRHPHHLGSNVVRLFPAGHILGSAMVHVSGERGSLLYTGDFRLEPSLTAEPAEVPHADAVIMESTYGAGPEWTFPSRDTLREQLLSIVRGILARNRTPVLLAYSLGKSQETAAMLNGSGIPLVMHPVTARISEIYERHGMDLGVYEVWSGENSLFGKRATLDLRGKALLIPPHMRSDIRRIPRGETVALTGWALRGGHGADHALPLSDHADYGELLRFAEMSCARVVYVTHGTKRFAADLRRRGIRAEFPVRKPQMRLF